MLAKAAADRQPITVLLSLKPPDGTTRFVDQIVSCKPDHQTVKYFSWRTALIGSYDVFHVHWPEWLLRHDRWFVRSAKYVLALLFFLKLRVKSIPVVRTVHNIEPHRPSGRIEASLLRVIDRWTSEFITLNPHTPCREPQTLIRHGHYIDRFNRFESTPVIPGRILFFGRIEPYKNVAALIDAFAHLDFGEFSLRIVGALDNSAFPDGGKALEAKIAETASVSARLEFVPDEELVREVQQAELVVLHYTEMHNSGALLVALSLGRVVYSIPSPSNHWIQDEVGADWLILDQQMTAGSLREAVARARALGVGQGAMPVLDDRDWSAIAEKHHDVYVRAVHRTRRPS